MIRKLSFALLFFLSFLLMNFRCEKEGLDRPFDQTFEIPLSISPLKKSYSLNDTIWIETLVQSKRLHDTKTASDIAVDTGNISLRVSYYGFGVGPSNPPGGFCKIISAGVAAGTELSQWTTLGKVEDYGCSQNSYHLKIGFKPLYKGTYCLMPTNDLLLQSCPGKTIPYHASINYRFGQVDLNEDIFNAFVKKENLSADQRRHFQTKLSKREMFVFNVE